MAKKQKKDVKNEAKIEAEEDFFKDIAQFFRKVDKSYIYTAAGIILILAFIALGFYYAKTSNNFTYNGITFNKTYLGKIQFYTAQVPTIGANGRIVSFSAIDFRNDPRKISDIKIESDNGLSFLNNKTLFITYQYNLKTCENNMLAAVNFYSFLRGFGLKPIGSLDNESVAKEQNITYATCDKYRNNTVVYVRQAKDYEETSIVKTANNCYEIITKDCDILEVIERFQLEILKNYMAGFKKVS